MEITIPNLKLTSDPNVLKYILEQLQSELKEIEEIMSNTPKPKKSYPDYAKLSWFRNDTKRKIKFITQKLESRECIESN